MTARPRMTTAERRARLIARHHLGRTADGVVEAVGAVVATHSSDPVTPYLACWARVPEFTTADLGRELHDTRTLWRLHAMRRTLFVVPTDEGAVFEAAASRDIAAKERRRLEGWLAAELKTDRVSSWLADVEARTLEVLGDGSEWRTTDLAEAVPELATEMTVGSGRWATRTRLSSRLLFLLAMDGHLVRTRPAGSWRSSQYRWAATASWFDRPSERIAQPVARAELARRYLASHGPATMTDLRWWTGWTARHAAAALEAVGAVTVALDDGVIGYVLPGDVEPIGGEAAGVAILPGLDSTPMGWKQRDWYVSDHVAALFDSNGNVGPTAWVDGRAAGGWGQRPDGEVVHRLLEDVGRDAATAVEAETAALTAWLGGVVVANRFPSPLGRELSS